MAAMKVGIGLPAGIPGADMSLVGQRAEEAEKAGFDADRVEAELRGLSEIGCTDVLLFPCSDEFEQLSILAAALTGSR
jgi:hypothetical protein